MLGLTDLSCSFKPKIPDFKTKINQSNGSMKWFTNNTRQTGEMPKEEWDVERIGHACFDEKDYAKIFKLFEKVCQRMTCVQEIIDEVDLYHTQLFFMTKDVLFPEEAR